jgi:hypothetical protein
MNEIVGLAVIYVLVVILPFRADTRFVVAFLGVFIFLGVFAKSTDRVTFQLSQSTAIVLALGIAGLTTTSGRRALMMFLPFFVVLTLGFAFVWPGDQANWGNAINLCVGVAAWVAGTFLSSKVNRDGSIARFIAVFVLAIFSFEMVVTVLQSAGVHIFAPGQRTLELEGSRANGTYNHPSTVGKVVLLLTMMILPLSHSRDRVTSTSVRIAMLVGLIPVVISESRANIISVVVMLFIWSILSPPPKGRGNRFALPGLIVAAGLAALPTIIARFANDPGGGERQHFMEVALAIIPKSLWFGVGPGDYIPVAGQFDWLTAQGWPVHNVFILETAEVGILATAFFFFPAIILYITAIGRLGSRDPSADYGRAALAALPGILIIATTGWGILQPFLLMLWFLGWGYMSGHLSAKVALPHQPEFASPLAQRQLLRG